MMEYELKLEMIREKNEEKIVLQKEREAIRAREIAKKQKEADLKKMRDE